MDLCPIVQWDHCSSGYLGAREVLFLWMAAVGCTVASCPLNQQAFDTIVIFIQSCFGVHKVASFHRAVC